jgi:hypothetical protein
MKFTAFEIQIKNGIIKKFTIHQPGFEPGFERWQRPVITATLLVCFYCCGAQTRT